MHYMAETALRLGHGVMLDATYGRPEQRVEVEEIASKVALAFLLVQCKVDANVAVERFESRLKGHRAIDLDPPRVALLAKSYPYCDVGLTIDTGQSVACCVGQLAIHIAKGESVTRGKWPSCAREASSVANSD